MGNAIGGACMPSGTHVIAVVTCGHRFIFTWADGDHVAPLITAVSSMSLDEDLPEFTPTIAWTVIQRIWSART